MKNKKAMQKVMGFLQKNQLVWKGKFRYEVFYNYKSSHKVDA